MTQENGHSLDTPQIALAILVVEDHESYRGVVCAALEGYIKGVRTLGAGSVTEAIGLLANHRVDVLVADMTLPDGTALDLLKEAHQHVAHGMKVILFSNYSSAEMQPLRERTDVHAVLTKEQGLRDLANAVRAVWAARVAEIGGTATTASQA